MDDSSLNTREGSRVVDYLIDFFIYLKNATGFRYDHFRAPHDLQETLETMEYYKMPREIWNAILNLAMKLAAELPRMKDGDQLISVITNIVITLTQYLLKYFFLRVALFILASLESAALSAIIICIYHFVTWAIIPVMNYIRPKLEEYAKFTFEQLKEFFYPSKSNRLIFF